MEQQKVNITSSMKKKGYSSSSHYRWKSHTNLTHPVKVF